MTENNNNNDNEKTSDVEPQQKKQKITHRDLQIKKQVWEYSWFFIEISKNFTVSEFGKFSRLSKAINAIWIPIRNHYLLAKQEIFERAVNKHKYDLILWAFKNNIHLKINPNCLTKQISTGYSWSARKSPSFVVTCKDAKQIELLELIVSDKRLNDAASNSAFTEIFSFAYLEGHKSLVEKFLARTDLGFTPSVLPKDPEMFKMIINKPNVNPLSFQCPTNPELLEILLTDERWHPSQSANNAIKIALTSQNEKLLKQLLDHKKFNFTVLSKQSFKSSSSEIRQVLFSHPQVGPALLFQWSCESGDTNLISWIFDQFGSSIPEEMTAKFIKSLSGVVNVSANLLDFLDQDKRLDLSACDNELILTIPKSFLPADKRLFLLTFLLKNPKVNPAARENELLKSLLMFGEINQEIIQMLFEDGRVDLCSHNNILLRKFPLRTLTSLSVFKILQQILSLIGSKIDPSAENDQVIESLSETCLSAATIHTIINDGRFNLAGQGNILIRNLANYEGKDRVEILELLLAFKGVDPAANNNEMITKLANTSRINLKLLKILQKDGRTDLSANDSIVLRRLWSYDSWEHYEILEILLQFPTIDPNAGNGELIKTINTYRGPAVINAQKNLVMTSQILELLMKDGKTDFDAHFNILTSSWTSYKVDDRLAILKLLLSCDQLNVTRTKTALYPFLPLFVRDNMDIIQYLIQEKLVLPIDLKGNATISTKWQTNETLLAFLNRPDFDPIPFLSDFLVDLNSYSSKDRIQLLLQHPKLQRNETLRSILSQMNSLETNVRLETIKLLLAAPNIDVNLDGDAFFKKVLEFGESAVKLCLEDPRLSTPAHLTMILDFLSNKKKYFDLFPLAVASKNADLTSNPQLVWNSFFSIPNYNSETILNAIKLLAGRSDVDFSIAMLTKTPFSKFNPACRFEIVRARYFTEKQDQVELLFDLICSQVPSDTKLIGALVEKFPFLDKPEKIEKLINALPSFAPSDDSFSLMEWIISNYPKLVNTSLLKMIANNPTKLELWNSFLPFEKVQASAQDNLLFKELYKTFATWGSNHINLLKTLLRKVSNVDLAIDNNAILKWGCASSDRLPALQSLLHHKDFVFSSDVNEMVLDCVTKNAEAAKILLKITRVKNGMKAEHIEKAMMVAVKNLDHQLIQALTQLPKFDVHRDHSELFEILKSTKPSYYSRNGVSKVKEALANNGVHPGKPRARKRKAEELENEAKEKEKDKMDIDEKNKPQQQEEEEETRKSKRQKKNEKTPEKTKSPKAKGKGKGRGRKNQKQEEEEDEEEKETKTTKEDKMEIDEKIKTTKSKSAIQQQSSSFGRSEFLYDWFLIELSKHLTFQDAGRLSRVSKQLNQIWIPIRLKTIYAKPTSFSQMIKKRAWQPICEIFDNNLYNYNADGGSNPWPLVWGNLIECCINVNQPKLWESILSEPSIPSINVNAIWRHACAFRGDFEKQREWMTKLVKHPNFDAKYDKEWPLKYSVEQRTELGMILVENNPVYVNNYPSEQLAKLVLPLTWNTSTPMAMLLSPKFELKEESCVLFFTRVSRIILSGLNDQNATLSKPHIDALESCISKFGPQLYMAKTEILADICHQGASSFFEFFLKHNLTEGIAADKILTWAVEKEIGRSQTRMKGVISIVSYLIEKESLNVHNKMLINFLKSIGEEGNERNKIIRTILKRREIFTDADFLNSFLSMQISSKHDIEILRTLIQNPDTFVDSKEICGLLDLVEVNEENEKELVQLLQEMFELDFRVDAMKSKGVFEKLMEIGSKPMIDLWMKNMEQKEIDGLLRIACRVGHPQFVKYLLTLPKIDASANDQEAIRNIFERTPPSVEILNLLLSNKKVDPGANNSESIRKLGPILNSHHSLLSPLLATKKVDPGANNNEFFKSVVENSQWIGLPHVLKLDCTKNTSSEELHSIFLKTLTNWNQHCESISHHPNFKANLNNDELLKTTFMKGITKAFELLLAIPSTDPMVCFDEATEKQMKFNGNFSYVPIYEMLLECKRFTNKAANNNQLLRFCISKDKKDMADIVLNDKKVKSTISANENQLFKLAISSKSFYFVKELLPLVEKSIDLNAIIKGTPSMGRKILSFLKKNLPESEKEKGDEKEGSDVEK